MKVNRVRKVEYFDIPVTEGQMTVSRGQYNQADTYRLKLTREEAEELAKQLSAALREAE